MAVNDELLRKVKLSMSILDNSSDEIIRQKIASAKDYLKGQGVSDNQLDTNEMAVEAISLYVNDFWTVGGKVESSPAFWDLVSKLYSNSIAEVLRNATTQSDNPCGC